jgi:hypothetical protein
MEQAADPRIVAASALEALEGLGFSQASVRMLRHGASGPALETIAAIGGRSTFMLGTVQDLDAAPESERVVSTGTALYVDDRENGADASGEGVARWKDALEGRGYAVLPLKVADQALGVLTLEWPDRSPEPRDRAALDIFAGVLALSLQATSEGGSADGPAGTSRAVAAPSLARVTALEVTDEGALFPPSAGAGMGLAPVAHLHVAATPATERHAAFVEAASGPPASVVLSAGVLHATGEAAGLVGSAAAVARAAAPNATDAATALGLLAGWIGSESRSGLALSAATALFVPSKNAFAVSTAGACAILLHDHDGRFGMTPPESPPFGGAARPRLETHVRLLLPGDRAAILIGHVAELGHGERAAAARDLMHGLHDRNTADVVRELLATVAPAGQAGAIVLLEATAEGLPAR